MHVSRSLRVNVVRNHANYLVRSLLHPGSHIELNLMRDLTSQGTTLHWK